MYVVEVVLRLLVMGTARVRLTYCPRRAQTAQELDASLAASLKAHRVHRKLTLPAALANPYSCMDILLVLGSVCMTVYSETSPDVDPRTSGALLRIARVLRLFRCTRLFAQYKSVPLARMVRFAC